MKRITLIAFIIFINLTTATAQVYSSDSLWIHKGTTSLNFSNVGLYNWAGGGQSSFSLNAIVALISTRESENTLWQNRLDLAYGFIRGRTTPFPYRKSDDLILLSSEYGYKFTEQWQLMASAQFRSQFDVGFEYTEDDITGVETRRKISDFFAPAYVNFNIGIQYRLKELLTASFYPISNRLTFVLDDSLSNAGAYGVEIGEKFRYQRGLSFRKTLLLPIMENISLKSELALFSAYSSLSRWVVNWDTVLVMTVNKFISVNFTTQLIYDPDVDIPQSNGQDSNEVQFKYVLNLGLAYTY